MKLNPNAPPRNDPGFWVIERRLNGKSKYQTFEDKKGTNQIEKHVIGSECVFRFDNRAQAKDMLKELKEAGKEMEEIA